MSQLFTLAGRITVITGVCGGLGSSFAKACNDAGGIVAGIDIKEECDSALAAQLRGFKYYRADVGDATAVEEVIKRIGEDMGQIWGCITCAGIAGQAPFHEYPEAQVREIVNVNLFGTYFTAQSIVRQLLRQGTSGSLVLIASVAAHESNELLPVSAYGATKFAVRGLAQQIAVEYSKANIRCNSISPGPVLTEMAKVFQAQAPAAFDALREKSMLKKMGSPEDLHGSVIFLLSDASSFITGEDILVDGGQCHF
ncbi:hypothetical protein G7Y79_00053g088430 [Physcia stellaris]|nr:hypothetical protein G7Y79_00053g088430 [Physcia stellaris]